MYVSAIAATAAKNIACSQRKLTKKLLNNPVVIDIAPIKRMNKFLKIVNTWVAEQKTVRNCTVLKYTQQTIKVSHMHCDV